MRLSDEMAELLEGAGGPSQQWAMKFNLALGNFFNADTMIPVSSAHFAPDIRMGGAACVRLLEDTVSAGARVKVPSYLDPCAVDFGRAAQLIAEYGLTKDFVAGDKRLQLLCRQVGFVATHTCINYQTVSPPAFGEHLAWGDTGAAVCANALFGARTNFEGGPSALASALLGYTPAYGMHLSEKRRGNLLVRLDCAPKEIADWGAVAAWVGALNPGYDTVPVVYGDFSAPSFAMLKQFGVALASYGGHAMFHVVGYTPEAVSMEKAFGGDRLPSEQHTMTQAHLDEMFEKEALGQRDVDLVVFAAPQLAIDEIFSINREMAGRMVHENTKLIIALDPQVKLQADNSGLADEMTALGVEFTTGTCFYSEAPLMREAMNWRTLVTNSAKLVNTLRSAKFDCSLQRLGTCINTAVNGRLTE